MRRVMITGGPGSGKSTLARAMGDITGLPVYHMDHIHWQAGWIQRPYEARQRMTLDIHARDAWIFEGGFSSTYDDRVARADTMIWLDVPVGLRLWRVLRRNVVHYGQTRPDLPAGCPEKFDAGTVEFVRFIWRTRHTARRKLEAIANAPPPHLSVTRLTRLAEVRSYLAKLRASAHGGAEPEV